MALKAILRCSNRNPNSIHLISSHRISSHSFLISHLSILSSKSRINHRSTTKMSDSDWSQLPEELLDRISTHLSFCIDLLRFRSVCSSWRSSTTYPPHTFPTRTPIHQLSPTGNFHLSKRIIVNLTSPHTPHPKKPWIIKLEQDTPLQSHLLNPLSESKIHPLPPDFPKTLNLINIQIHKLSEEHVLRYAEDHPYAFAGDVYREKVVFSTHPPGNNNQIDHVIMTIHVSGKLALFRFKDNTWQIIDEMPNPYDDLILYKDDFYAVDGNGRLVIVGESCKATDVAGNVFGGDKKYLVECNDELLLVDRYLSIGSDDQPFYTHRVEENDEFCFIDSTVQFKVYKLDRVGKSWVEVKNLGDSMLFLGDNCSFSGNAREFGGSKGNCIYFTDRYFRMDGEEDGAFKDHCIGVFNLEDGSIGPLAASAGYSQLFWPPPEWVTLPAS